MAETARTAVLLFYRITKGEVATEADFLSNEARGRPAPANDPEAVALWGGISVYDSEDAARSVALYYRLRIGRYIAEMSIPHDAAIAVRKTRENPAHYTLWADPLLLLSRVSWVKAVRSTDEQPG